MPNQPDTIPSNQILKLKWPTSTNNLKMPVKELLISKQPTITLKVKSLYYTTKSPNKLPFMIKKLPTFISDSQPLLVKPLPSNNLSLIEKNKLLLKELEQVILTLKLKDKDNKLLVSKVNLLNSMLLIRTYITKLVNCNQLSKKDKLLLPN